MTNAHTATPTADLDDLTGPMRLALHALHGRANTMAALERRGLVVRSGEAWAYTEAGEDLVTYPCEGCGSRVPVTGQPHHVEHECRPVPAPVSDDPTPAPPHRHEVSYRHPIFTGAAGDYRGEVVERGTCDCDYAVVRFMAEGRSRASLHVATFPAYRVWLGDKHGPELPPADGEWIDDVEPMTAADWADDGEDVQPVAVRQVAPPARLSRVGARVVAVLVAMVAAVLAMAAPASASEVPPSEDCYALNVGTPGAPWWVLVSDATTDGLCHATGEGDDGGPRVGEYVGVNVGEELTSALLAAGFTGGDDGTDDVVYAPVGTVLDVPGGTWTITRFGPVRCTDWVTTGAECDGRTGIAL